MEGRDRVQCRQDKGGGKGTMLEIGWRGEECSIDSRKMGQRHNVERDGGRKVQYDRLKKDAAKAQC